MWGTLKTRNTHVIGLTVLSKSIAVHSTSHVPALVKEFDATIKRVYELQRIGAAAFFAELINQQYETLY